MGSAGSPIGRIHLSCDLDRLTNWSNTFVVWPGQAHQYICRVTWAGSPIGRIHLSCDLDRLTNWLNTSCHVTWAGSPIGRIHLKRSFDHSLSCAACSVSCSIAMPTGPAPLLLWLESECLRDYIIITSSTNLHRSATHLFLCSGCWDEFFIFTNSFPSALISYGLLDSCSEHHFL